MATRFLSDTPYAGIEREMQRIPKFNPRASGMAVSHFEYSAKDCDCRFCIHRTKNNKCGKVQGCMYLQERLVAGCVTFGELLRVLATEVAVSPFAERLSRLSKCSHSRFFITGHRERFESVRDKNIPIPNKEAICAALYLLSADTFLWGKSVSFIQQDSIRFKEIKIHGVDLNGYVLFHTAKDLYQGTNHISISELIDPELVGDITFELIVTAFLIRRYGHNVLNAERMK